MQKIYIREAGKEDADLIANISRFTFFESFAPFNSTENMNKFMNEQFSHEMLAEEVSAKHNRFILAYEDDELVGYAKLSESPNPEQLGPLKAIEICRIYSLQSKIGKGVGKKLMEACLDLAKRMGKEIIWLGVWEHNTRAIEFYKKWGFDRFGEHEFILGDDIQTDWLLKKAL